MDAAVTRLREVAGPDLYRRNAFRVTGVGTDANRSAVRQRRQLVVAAVAAGADIDLGHGLAVTEPQVRAAFDVLLGDSRRRLADEVFWLWGGSRQLCGCHPRVHREHDAAVRAHSAVLDAEADPDAAAARVAELWSDAVRHWRLALRRADLWEHLRHRVGALDDRALDVSTVEALRDAVPATLVKPLVELALSARDPARLVDIARDWPVPDRVVDDLLDQAAEPLYVRLSTVSGEAFGLLDRNEFDAAATHVERMAVADLRRLESLLPAERFRRTGTLRDQMAVLLNNCALAVLDRHDDAHLDRAHAWLVTARELAAGADVRQGITANFAMLEAARRRAELRRQRDQRLADRRRRQEQRGQEWRVIEQERQRQAEGRRRERQQRYRQRLAGLRSLDAVFWRSFWRLRADLLYFEANGVWRPLVAAVAGVLFALGVVGVLWWAGHKPKTALVWAEQVSANAPVGQCIGAAADWSATNTTVRLADCARPHWGEVLGYPRLASSPAPYPGDDQVVALARFQCGLLLSGRGLSATVYDTSYISPGSNVWNTGGTRFENYATCVVHRRDDAPLSGGRLVDPSRREPTSVRMSLFADSIAMNPPVGSCIADEREFTASMKDVAMVPCGVMHWAEVVGYPVLYEPGTPWPGDAATLDAAEAACARSMAVPKDFQLHTIWPSRDWWNLSGSRKYAMCLALRIDGQPFRGGVQ